MRIPREKFNIVEIIANIKCTRSIVYMECQRKIASVGMCGVATACGKDEVDLESRDLRAVSYSHPPGVSLPLCLYGVIEVDAF